MLRHLQINRNFWLNLSLLLCSISFSAPAWAQFHQPVRRSPGLAPSIRTSSYRSQPGFSHPQYQSAVQRQSAIRPVSTFQVSGQVLSVPPAPAESYLQNPVQDQLQGSSVPPAPRAFSSPGGHTFQSGPVVSPSLPGRIYTSPYDASSMPMQGIETFRQSGECTECVEGYYEGACCWGWSILPKELLYKSYLGGPREPRMGQGTLYLKGVGWIWALEAGGRVGLVRYGSGPGEPPEGWQLDIWGAAFPRLNFNEGTELDAVDFKVGIPLTWSQGPYQLKFEWNHISSHLGDEFMLRNPGFVRIDYLRDAFVLGGGYFVNPDLRLYADAEYAYNTNGGSEPWHFQFGVDYSPAQAPAYEQVRHPQPFFAINGNLREEANFSGGVNVVAGLQWRGVESDALFRMGLQYYQGQSLQLEFIDDYEELIGVGIWYDF